MGEVTHILRAIDNGDIAAASELLPLVYAELRNLAEKRISNEAAGHTLQATALVHEAYLRLVVDRDGNEVKWDGRAHFFGAAAEAMRRILVDHARAKGAVKRGGDVRRLPLPTDIGLESSPEAVLQLNDALEAFANEEPEKAQIVKLRFFAGLTLQQASEVMGISTATANRYWSFARAWLYHELTRDRNS